MGSLGVPYTNKPPPRVVATFACDLEKGVMASEGGEVSVVKMSDVLFVVEFVPQHVRDDEDGDGGCISVDLDDVEVYDDTWSRRVEFEQIASPHSLFASASGGGGRGRAVGDDVLLGEGMGGALLCGVDGDGEGGGGGGEDEGCRLRERCSLHLHRDTDFDIFTSLLRDCRQVSAILCIAPVLYLSCTGRITVLVLPVYPWLDFLRAHTPVATYADTNLLTRTMTTTTTTTTTTAPIDCSYRLLPLTAPIDGGGATCRWWT